MKEHLNSFTKLEFDKVLSRLTSFAATDLGKSKIRSLTPLSTLQEIYVTLKRVSEMKGLLEAGIPPSFEGVVDCRAPIHRASITGNILSAPELRQIANLLTATRRLKSHFEKRKQLAPEIASECHQVQADKVLEFNIDKAINENGEVLDSASNHLRQIRVSILNLREALTRQIESILRTGVKNDWTQEEIITTREGRMVIPVKVEHKQQIPGFIHSTSASGATVFIEPAETLELNNEIRSLLFEEEREIQHILKELTDQVGAKSSDLLTIVGFVENLDVLFAKALYSIDVRGAELSIEPDAQLFLQAARHPLLEVHDAQGGVVPLNIEYRKDYRAILISGPNAGGKSVALKTVGLIAVMVHHGMHAPASPDSSLPLIDNIFVDIGDEQSIENNLSTFTSHLSNLKLICENATPASLVLIDEICAGTDPSEGGALAAAVLKTLTGRECFTIATTHIGFLKAFATNTPGIINASMEFNQATLTPTYRLLLGSLGSSYAFAIARRLHISEELLSQANTILGLESRQLSELIVMLEKERVRLSRERENLEINNKNLQQLTENYEERYSKLKNETQELRRKAIEEAKQILDRSSSLVERSIREIREHQGERSTILKVKEGLRKHANEVSRLLEDFEQNNSSDATRFSPGDFVRLNDRSEVGEVIEIARNNIIVRFNNMKIAVEKGRLVHADSRTNLASPVLHQTLPAPPGERRIDVRGYVGDEAITAVDKSIDNAVLSGLNQLEIIHGKGTGALRKRIHDYLSNDHRVESFRSGEWNEGGLGATIVKLL